MRLRLLLILSLAFLCWSCKKTEKQYQMTIYETNAAGDQLSLKKPLKELDQIDGTLQLDPEKSYQSILGFGGAFTESSAHLLKQLKPELRTAVLKAYFAEEGANYSMARTHMNSCDFSLSSYSYAPVENDTALEHFAIEEDREDLIPMIKQAQEISKEGFKLLSSPWTAPPWMKDNQAWFGGKLLTEFYPTWANYFVKYQKDYQAEGIPIWGFTIENEPLGNDAHWESMHFSPEEMALFVKEHLAPTLKENQLDPELYVFDQNKGEELAEWSEALLTDTALLPHIAGTAVHWYASTVKTFDASLQETHKLAPDKSIIHSEACIDAEVPHWKEDDWYWKKEATDWGYQWAPEDKKADHPKYVPAYRYARDIIGCMNNWVEAWIDWNMVLDPQGGPNHAKNWCVAPILVDTAKQEVYKTPLYYVLSHFSKFVRPGAKRIAWNSDLKDLQSTAFVNPEGEVIVILFNPTKEPIELKLALQEQNYFTRISGQAIQSLLLENKN